MGFGEVSKVFDLKKEEANELAEKLEEEDRILEVWTTVGGVNRGERRGAYAVRFEFELETGHRVLGEIHEPKSSEAPDR